jgi:hypothetical protein
MASNIERYKDDLARLIKLGSEMLRDAYYENRAEHKVKLSDEDKADAATVKNSFRRNYQKWFTEAAEVIRQLLPTRLDEFVHHYKGDGKRKKLDNTTYTVQDWLMGIRSRADFEGNKYFDDSGVATSRLQTQTHILASVERRFESSLFDIRQLVQADLFDSEIDAARELLKHGFLRAAGAVAGVVLEKHLAQVADNHQVAIKKKHPTIADLNDALKAASVADVPLWRKILRLGDLRNLCDHNKEREPTIEEVGELIDGADKLVKSLF